MDWKSNRVWRIGLSVHEIGRSRNRSHSVCCVRTVHVHLRYLSNLPELSGELPLLGFCRPDLRTSAGSAERKSRCRLFSNGFISSPGRSRCHWTLADSMADIIAWEEILKSSLPDVEKETEVKLASRSLLSLANTRTKFIQWWSRPRAGWWFRPRPRPFQRGGSRSALLSGVQEPDREGVFTQKCLASVWLYSNVCQNGRRLWQLSKTASVFAKNWYSRAFVSLLCNTSASNRQCSRR